MPAAAPSIFVSRSASRRLPNAIAVTVGPEGDFRLVIEKASKLMNVRSPIGPSGAGTVAAQLHRREAISVCYVCSGAKRARGLIGERDESSVKNSETSERV